MKVYAFNSGDKKELQIAFNDAVKNNHESFVFKGQEVLTQYAKYLLEYLN